MEFCSQRTPQLVVAERYNFTEVTGTLFVVRGNHDCFWSKVPEVKDDYIIIDQPHIIVGMTGVYISMNYSNNAIIFIHASIIYHGPNL